MSEHRRAQRRFPLEGPLSKSDLQLTGVSGRFDRFLAAEQTSKTNQTNIASGKSICGGRLSDFIVVLRIMELNLNRSLGHVFVRHLF